MQIKSHLLNNVIENTLNLTARPDYPAGRLLFYFSISLITTEAQKQPNIEGI